jgi:hypothetical protein
MSIWQQIIDFIKKLISSTTTTTTTGTITNTTTTMIPLPIPTGTLKGYGMVCYWMNLSNFDTLMSTLKNNNCNCTSIELFGREEDGWINKQDVIKSQFTKMVTSARKYGITIFVDMINGANESGQTDAWFQDWLNFIKSFGSNGLVIQTAAEWNDSKMANWCVMTENTLTGFALSWNKGARPQTATSKYKYIDYHSTTLTDLGGPDKRTICNTDSQILNTMMNGGVMGQTFKTDQVTTFGTGALKAGKSVNLYGYAHQSIDPAAIQALGKCGGSVPVDPSGDVTEASMGLSMATLDARGDSDPRHAQITCQLTKMAVTKGSGGLSLRWTPHTFVGGDGLCDGWVVVFWKNTTGGWMSGLTENCPNGNTFSDGQGYDFASDTLVNIYNNPNYVPQPIKGSNCDFGIAIVSKDAKQRSNVAFGTWPL